MDESYAGCWSLPSFHFDGVDDDVNQVQTFLNSSSMTISECQFHCRFLGYLYAGLNAGINCFCINTPSPLTLGCSIPCGGNPQQKCGGIDSVSVYATRPCPLGCHSCQSAERCDICLPNLVLYQGNCLSSCPLGSFLDGDLCIECDCVSSGIQPSICDGITGRCECLPSHTGNRCEACNYGYLKFNQECIPTNYLQYKNYLGCFVYILLDTRNHIQNKCVPPN
eukprot:Lithocolla_globosa_v1_NODE_103_length_6349_cov_4.180489.p3 type:complete len:223 gc:universal NODE_103_length_6349_cov_4.180489:1955-1287(-)